MNREMIGRMKTAGKYQKKAIRALLPQEAGEHLDVIEREVRLLALELAGDLLGMVRKQEGSGAAKEAAKEAGGTNTSSNVRRVDIG